MVEIRDYVIKSDDNGKETVYLVVRESGGEMFYCEKGKDGECIGADKQCKFPIDIDEETAKLLKGGKLSGWIIKTHVSSYSVLHPLTHKQITVSYAYSYKNAITGKILGLSLINEIL